MDSARVVLTPLDPRYPSRLRALERPPASIVVEGGSLDADLTVAIVGSREAHERSLTFAHELATAVAQIGAVVVSGGAAGVDGAAHGATLGCGGRTWVVAATVPTRCFPEEHEGLFRMVAAGPGAMIWPFTKVPARRPSFTARNGILIALSDVVVVVQAGARSGALNAARWARCLAKPLWVVPVAPWLDTPFDFDGTRQLLEAGVRPLTTLASFMRSLGQGRAPRAISAMSTLGANESKVLSAICNVPRHLDFITTETHLPTHTTAAALLTLALENVVVEGPPGFFRRRDAL
jgi:DNA processing protein